MDNKNKLVSLLKETLNTLYIHKYKLNLVAFKINKEIWQKQQNAKQIY